MDTFIEVEHGFGKRLTVLLNCSSVKSRGFSEVPKKSEIPPLSFPTIKSISESSLRYPKDGEALGPILVSISVSIKLNEPPRLFSRFPYFKIKPLSAPINNSNSFC